VSLGDHLAVFEDKDPVGVTDGRDAMRDQMVVRPRMTAERPERICSSVAVSTLDSASSRINMRGLRRMALAMAVRCFGRRKSDARSPTMVW